MKPYCEHKRCYGMPWPDGHHAVLCLDCLKTCWIGECICTTWQDHFYRRITDFFDEAIAVAIAMGDATHTPVQWYIYERGRFSWWSRFLRFLCWLTTGHVVDSEDGSMRSPDYCAWCGDLIPPHNITPTSVRDTL